MKKTLKGLVAYLQEQEQAGRINQGIGAAFVRDGQPDELRECGMCFGGHLAKWFRTPVHACKLNAIPADGMALVDIRERIYDGELGHSPVLKFRHFKDGIAALHDQLLRFPAFRRFNERLGNKTTAKSGARDKAIMLSHYLQKRCGMPKTGFQSDAWRSTTPSEVVKRLIDLHPRLAF